MSFLMFALAPANAIKAGWNLLTNEPKDGQPFRFMETVKRLSLRNDRFPGSFSHVGFKR
jgi:hypothetical protein